MVFLGNGDGTFQAALNSGLGGVPSGLAVADFNQDGKLDLVVAGTQDNVLEVLHGRGDGTFTAGIASYVTDAPPQGVAVGDFNRDGIPDVAVGTASGEVEVFLGVGNGRLRSPVSYLLGASSAEVTSGDFNGDGIQDIAAADTLTNSVFLLLGAGDGTFEVQAVSFGVSGVPRGIVAGDLNGDAKLTWQWGRIQVFHAPSSIPRSECLVAEELRVEDSPPLDCAARELTLNGRALACQSSNLA